MSAATQRNTAPRTAPAPKPRPMLRPNGIHHGKTRAEIITQFEKSKWAGRALDLHLFRVTGGGAMGAWIRFVYDHTSGSPNPADRRKFAEFSPVVHPEDAAKEFGLSVQMMREARNACVEKGFTPRKSTKRADGRDYFRYALDLDAMAKAPNSWDAQRSETAREDAFVPRKPAGSEGVEKAKTSTLSATSVELRESVIAPEPAPLPAGEVAVLAVQQPEVEVTHALPCPVAIQQTVSDSGRLRIHLSSPVAQPEDARKSNPASVRGKTSAPAGAGPRVVNSATGNVVQLKADLFGVLNPASLRHLHKPADTTLVLRVAEALGDCPTQNFEVALSQRLKRSTNIETAGLFLAIAEDVRKAWDAEAPLRLAAEQEAAAGRAKFEAALRAEFEACPERYRLAYEAPYPTVQEIFAALDDHDSTCPRCRAKGGAR